MTTTIVEAYNIVSAEAPKSIKALLALALSRCRKVKDVDLARAVALTWLVHAAAVLADQKGMCTDCFGDLARDIALGPSNAKRTPTHTH